MNGFMAFAPDALTSLGGYPGDEEKAVSAFATLDRTKMLEDFVAAAQWLKANPDGTGKLGAVGFCFGGGIVHMLSIRVPDLAAGVPFYGNTPDPADATRVKAPLLVQQADVDERINASWPAYEAALKTAGVKYTAYRYPGTQHGFNNDTTPRYDEAAARLVWERTVAIFKIHLPTTSASPVVRLRGKIESMSATGMRVRERGGELIDLALSADLVVNEVYAIALSDIKPGSFIGAGAMLQADGKQRAIAVTVFPEAMRGTGEGHRPFDFMPQSTMTNAAVADVIAAPDGHKLQVRYKDGEKTIVIPPGTLVVTFKPTDCSLLVLGASVSLSAQTVRGQPTALRISVGRNGFAVPY